MTGKDDMSFQASELRRQAEAMALEKPALSLEDIHAMSAEEIQQMLHGLRVHQIKLEVQYEELRRAQAEIEAGRARYFDLYDQAPVGYCTLSEHGLIIEANLTAATLMGSSRSELVAQPLSRFIHSDDQHIYSLHHKQLLETATLQKCDLRLVKPGGDYIWAHLKETVVQADNGAPLCRVVLSDISGRIRAEKQRETLAKKYAAVVSTTRDAVLTVNLDGRITVFNPGAEKLFGCTAEEALGSPVMRFCPEDLLKEQAEMMRRVLDIGEVAGYKSERLTADGRRIPVEITLNRNTDDQDSPSEINAILRDITERKQVEEALRIERERLAYILEGTNVGTWEWNVQTGETIFNERWAEIIGYSLAEISPVTINTWMTLTHPDDLKNSGELLQRHFSGGLEHYECEARMRHKNGEWVWVLDRGKVVAWTEDGKPLHIVGTHQDITKRKRGEEALRESEEQLRQLVHHLHSGVIAHAPDTKILIANEQASRILGLSIDQMKGKNAIDPAWRFVREDESILPLEEYPVQRVLATRQPISDLLIGVDRPVTKDRVWATVNAFPEFDTKGRLRQVVVTFFDITERKQAEESLRKSEERFLLAMKASHDGIFDWNLETNDIYYSPAWKNMLGYEDHELPNDLSVWEKTTDPEDVKNSWALHQKLITKQIDRFVMEIIMKHKDGHWVDILSRAEAIFSESGKAVRMIGTHTDITKRKQAEEALIRQQRFIQLNNQIANVFLTSSQDKVFADVLDVILAALDSRFGYFGYIDEAGDLVSPTLTRDVWDQCQVADKSIVFPRASWGGLWGRSLLEKQTFISNENLQVPQGHVALENALATPIVFNNTLIGQFVVANKAGGYDKDDRDLLESVAAQTAPILFAIQEEVRQKIVHEKLENQLQQAQKMESVGRLAGGVAHDFNNMLGVILGYTELAMKRVEPDDPLHANLEKIQGAAQRSADLTRQLLAFARKQTVSPKVIDLNDTIESMLKLLRRLIGEDIDLDWRPGKEVWPIKIDPTQVDQILTNLCVNARDAIVDTGKVTIETGTAFFDEEYCSRHADFVPGEYVLLAVSDTGCGMDKETQFHLFEPFFTTKEVGKGTGLGMATVYGAIKQNNGFINVYSEPGKGTTFKIYLPSHLDKTVPLPEKELDKPDERGNETVLLVEDEPTILDMTTEMLERLGYTVLAAGTPGEAVRLAQEHPGRIDLLLTDVVMPEMNGRDLAKNLLSIYPEIRRLFMSGYTADVIAYHGVLDEGVHFIHKPFSINDLGGKLREALEG